MAGRVRRRAGNRKSRLLAELCARAEDRGYLLLDGRAAEFERDIPFGLIVDALNDYLGSLEPALLRSLDEGLVADLASVFPSVPRDVRTAVRLDDTAERYGLHYAIRSVLERLSARQPLLMALDDVHWADSASVEVPAHAAAPFPGFAAHGPRVPPAAGTACRGARGGSACRLGHRPRGTAPELNGCRATDWRRFR